MVGNNVSDHEHPSFDSEHWDVLFYEYGYLGQEKIIRVLRNVQDVALYSNASFISNRAAGVNHSYGELRIAEVQLLVCDPISG